MPADEYFQGVAEEVFSGTLLKLGGKITHRDECLIRFESSEWFVELLALPDDGPRYSPRVEMGPLPELGFLVRQKQVDILHALPSESSLRRYNLLWTYSDPSSMRDVFVKVRDEIFIPFAVPILTNYSRLNELVKVRSKQVDKEWRDQINKHNDSVYRSKARIAFLEKNYSMYLELMKHIPIDRQTNSERGKVSLSLKRDTELG